MNYITLIVVFSFLSSGVYGQSTLEKELCRHVSALANDSMKGRYTGSVEEKMANEYLKSEWIASKRVKNMDWNYSIQLGDSIVQSQMTGCFINNKKDSTILIGAHIDHIGYGGNLSKSLSSSEIHNGADDNASGVALLIELQKSLAKTQLNYNVLLVAYTGHEIGMYGSKYLANHLPKKGNKLALVINFDMVGRLNEKGDLYVSASREINHLFQIDVEGINQIRGTEEKLMLLDTQHFYPKTPCVTITTGMHNDYHKITDDLEYINCSGIEILHTWTLEMINKR